METRHQTRRVWCLTVGALALLIVVGAALILFYDVTPPDNSALQAAYDGPMPATDQQRFDELTRYANRNTINPAAFKLEVQDVPFAEETLGTLRESLAGEQTLIDTFDSLMLATHHPVWRWQHPGRLFASEWSLLPNTTADLIAGTVHLSILLDIEDGHEVRAINRSLDLARFAISIPQADSSLPHYVAMWKAHRNSILLLEKALVSNNPTPEFLSDLQDQITPLEPDLTRYLGILTFEPLYFRDVLATQHASPDLAKTFTEGKLPMLAPFLVKPGICAVMHQEDNAALRSALHRGGWSAGLLTLSELIKRNHARTLPPSVRHPNFNYVGARIYQNYLDRTFAIHRLVLNTLAINRQAVILLALRRHELDFGWLPAQLDELVPAYLPAVPLDPFTGQPMQWFFRGPTLYSLGSDLHDDRGLVGLTCMGDFDVGMHYWWQDNAASYRPPYPTVSSLPSRRIQRIRTRQRVKPTPFSRHLPPLPRPVLPPPSS